ncbi:hypothetical protein DENSPDRAFT_816777 [Dentipellis sp. KUC8613]|nr:hypothetical protein DENSPDRAFT_816777 [Dentipellis sp. KUC8613]
MADFMDEKARDTYAAGDANPVVESAEFALKKTNLVQINDEGVKGAAALIHARMHTESYTPRTWRTHALHLRPPEPYDAAAPGTRATLDWVFLVSALNFSFWSAREDSADGSRYGVQWRAGWDSDIGEEEEVVHTGYWSLVAAVDRALDEDIPITSPAFYASEALCPDSLIEHVFRAAPRCREGIPLLRERIAVMREVGFILCASFGGSFQGFLDEFKRRYGPEGTALQLVQMVTDTFPSFRDETWYEGRRVFFWKRAQILAAETWAAFYPAHGGDAHPLFPHGMRQLTMFADYRVPQILHHLRILAYPPALVRMLRAHAPLAPGGREEVSVRAASVVAVERLREAIGELQRAEAAARRGAEAEAEAEAEEGRGEGEGEGGEGGEEPVSSVLIDFYLWDLAKRLECGSDRIEGVQTEEIVPAHRTRSIWY